MPKDTQPKTARQDLVAFLNAIGNVSADRINPAFKSKYASLSEILDTVKAVAREHNLAVHQSLSSADGQVRVTTVFIHDSGEIHDSGTLAFVAPGDAQKLGSAITYLRRQSLQTACGISTDIDDDGASASSYKASQAPSQATLKSNAPWYSFLTAMEAERAHQYCVTKGWLSEKSIDLIELPADKVDMILSNKPSFIKAISK